MNKTVVSRKHLQYVLLALKTLELPRSGDITKWVNDKVKSDIENNFNSHKFPYKPCELDELKAKELEDFTITQRGVQLILSKLQSKRVVSKNEHDQYALAEETPLKELKKEIMKRMSKQIRLGGYTMAALDNGQWVAGKAGETPIIFGSPLVSSRDYRD